MWGFIEIGTLSRAVSIRVVEIKNHTTTTFNRTVPVSRATSNTRNKIFLNGYFLDYLFAYINLINLSKIVKNEWDKIDKQIPDLEKEKLEFISTFPDELKELYDNLKKRGLEVIAAYRNDNQCGCCGVELTSSEIEFCEVPLLLPDFKFLNFEISIVKVLKFLD